MRAGLVSRFYVSISADICLYLLLLCAFMIRVRVPLSQVQNKKNENAKKRPRIFHACFALLRLAPVLTHVFPYPPRFLEHFLCTLAHMVSLQKIAVNKPLYDEVSIKKSYTYAIATCTPL